jgi:transmembrane sensor
VAVSPTGGGKTNRDSSHADEIALSSNQQLAISRRGAAAQVRRIDGRIELARSQGQIIFENDTLAAIVQRLNTYNRTQIRVTDPVLAARSVSGVLLATDPQSFVAFLESVGGVTAREGGPDEIIIERSDASQPELAPR